MVCNIEKFIDVTNIVPTTGKLMEEDTREALETCKCYNCGICETYDGNKVCMTGDINGPFSFSKWKYLAENERFLDSSRDDVITQEVNDNLCKKWTFNYNYPYSDIYPAYDAMTRRVYG